MTEMEIVLNAAIFAVAKMEDKGSTAYAVKDRSGSWHQMEWSAVTSKLYKLLTLKEYNNKEKTGHWITAKDEYGDIYEAVCSCCDKNGVHKYNYCPWCGARMEVENE